MILAQFSAIISDLIKDYMFKLTVFCRSMCILITNVSLFTFLSSAGVSTGLSRKDELFNDLLDDCASRGVDFLDSLADNDGKYVIQVWLCFKLNLEYLAIDTF